VEESEIKQHGMSESECRNLVTHGIRVFKQPRML